MSGAAAAAAPRVSVVVPSFRRPPMLARCLEALCAQDLPPASYEIVVVDDDDAGSALDTVDDCRERHADGPPIRYCLAAGTQGPAAARNLGWRTALAPLIAFTDDDTLPAPDWLRAGLDTMAAHPFAAAAAGRIEVPLGPRPTDYERDAGGLAHAEFATANCFVRRAALERIGGFDEAFTRAWREDADLMFRLREQAGPIVAASEATVLHPVRPARWGVSLGQQSKVYFDALLFKKHRRAYRRHIRPTPPWNYYAAVAALLAALVRALAGAPWAALGCAVVWAAVTAQFCARRLRGAALTPAHVAEMVVTSILIPPVSLYWRLRGAIHFKVPFV